MKKVIMLFMMLISLVSMEAQSIKGFELGKEYNGYPIESTTIADLPFVINGYTLDDGRIWQIIAISGERFDKHTGNYKPLAMYSTDIDILKDVFNRHFGIDMVKTTASDYSGSFTYEYYDTNTFYMIMAESLDMDGVKYKVSIIITDKKLSQVYENQVRNQAGQDI